MTRAALLLACLLVTTAALACGRPPDVRSPAPELALDPSSAHRSWTRARAIFDGRCVVCHGCYDAPCQLKLGSYEGIDRGASEEKVYEASRLLAASPTRLGVDAHGRMDWRKKGFHPVLPEGVSAAARSSVLVRMLELKRAHPMTTATDVARDFTLDLDREQTCTDAKSFDRYAADHPTWGMPYAMPGIAAEDEKTLVDWVRAGAPHEPPAALDDAHAKALDAWEAFLNEDSIKGRLVGRYIYEHLFLASLRFEDLAPPSVEAPLFRLVRSRTKPGAPIEEIPTRRPFDDPGSSRVFYRFQRREDTPLEKTNMPYALSAKRLADYRAMFLGTPWSVDRLPGYEPEVAANPFRAFRAIPTRVRYEFMLEESEFTLMGFIKGPVCRGQVALNVIQDRFWIVFVAPDVPWNEEEATFLAANRQDLDMPAEAGSQTLPTAWFRYGDAHGRYVDAKQAFLERATRRGQDFTAASLWDGDGKNPNAALTVFRHFDSATVVKGLVGGYPKTAWLMDYPLLERIHYLLVAGFDVFGNVGHQIVTRLYMDYLRMEGEAGFLAMLPIERRAALVDGWYRGVSGKARTTIRNELVGQPFRLGVPLASDVPPERAAYDLFLRRLAPVLERSHTADAASDPALATLADRLASAPGLAANAMPEVSFVAVEDDREHRRWFTVLRDSAHTNVAHLFREEARRIPAEDRLTVTRGWVGAYPNALFQVRRADLSAFTDAVTTLTGPESYRALRERWGVRRNTEDFWPYSDRLHADHLRSEGILGGLFDFNRLQAY